MKYGLSLMILISCHALDASEAARSLESYLTDRRLTQQELQAFKKAVHGKINQPLAISHRPTPLMLAAENRERPELAEYLLAHHANINAQDEQGYTALVYAIIPFVYNIFSPQTFTYFEYSTAQSQQVLHMIKLLLNAGADPNIAANNGITPVMAAVLTNNPDIVELVLNAGGTTQGVDTYEYRPSKKLILHYLDRPSNETEIMRPVRGRGRGSKPAPGISTAREEVRKKQEERYARAKKIEQLLQRGPAQRGDEKRKQASAASSEKREHVSSAASAAIPQAAPAPKSKEEQKPPQAPAPGSRQ